MLSNKRNSASIFWDHVLRAVLSMSRYIMRVTCLAVDQGIREIADNSDCWQVVIKVKLE